MTVANAAVVEPFEIAVSDESLDDLRSRLARTRWPDAVEDAGWDYGTDLEYARELCDYWRGPFDWRAQEEALNALPQYRADIDGLGIHFVHVKGEGPNPIPLVLTHGWPSSFCEMRKVIGPLSNPAAYGGDPADAFDVVAPSLPGYGFSDAPRERGCDTNRIADIWVQLMVDVLGYERFGAQGGDWGAAVNAGLGTRHAERLIGLHYNMLTPPIDEATLTLDERIWWEEVKAYRAQEWGYVQLQSTKPQSLAFGLADSPSGLAAWIIEKWRRWSDCAGDIESVYTKDELLTNIMIYWITNSISSSLRLYFESFGPMTGPPAYSGVDVPTGVAAFNEVNRPPRALCEPHFDLRRFTVMDRGGHFPAMENPDGLIDEVRAFFRPLRT
ncbi:MAG: epoxide hydrolase [bacterium]|nr:multidrug MFS transporter [Deltaproteobacteria bacterium]MCP4908448.1 epoxide hydrolase [bacterium]